jgi:hypothetical protein
MQIKKPAWLSMPVLDVRTLSTAQLTALAVAYDTLATEPLDALAQLHNDQARQSVDKALSNALGLPDLAPIRELLSRVPGLNAIDINPRRQSPEVSDDAAEDDDQEEMTV